jgi:hypothetical protein
MAFYAGITSLISVLDGVSAMRCYSEPLTGGDSSFSGEEKSTKLLHFEFDLPSSC